jgi:hypothetical protein
VHLQLLESRAHEVVPAPARRPAAVSLSGVAVPCSAVVMEEGQV